MREHLEEMTREHELERRVTLLGDVPHASVVDVLQRAHVFLNCSLTESFCIAILEAACSGCLVVATGVGGVTEVLPPDLLFLAAPDPDALVEALADALDALRTDGTTNDPRAIHERVAKMYAWEDVAARVEAVYERAHATVDSRLGRLARLHGCGTARGEALPRRRRGRSRVLAMVRVVAAGQGGGTRAGFRAGRGELRRGGVRRSRARL